MNLRKEYSNSITTLTSIHFKCGWTCEHHLLLLDYWLNDQGANQTQK